jgi:glutamyl-tRNA reductase
MHIHCLGMSHNTAGIALRERLAFSPEHLQAALARIGCGDDPAWQEIHELAILSTCHRVELYAVAPRPIFDILIDFLSQVHQIPASDFSGAHYRLLDQEAIQHLFQVAAGLDSVVVGEAQILGQVTAAYMTARKQGATSKLLNRLFQAAIHAGKRARTETMISYNPASIASVAVRLISDKTPHLSSARVMVIGAGEMSELAVESLRKRGVQDILVVNRTLEKAQELAHRWDGHAAALEYLPVLLADVDVVVTSTGAPHLVILRSMVEEAMNGRQKRPLIFMDIAVPRDVAPDVDHIPGVLLYDIDALAERLEISLEKREAEIPKVEIILAEEQAAFEEYLATLDVVPIIVGLRERADQIRQTEVAKAIRRMPDLNPEIERQIEALSQSIINKILHQPTTRLREEASGPDAASYARVTRGLFGLD